MGSSDVRIGLLAATEAQLDALAQLAIENNLLPVRQWLTTALQSDPGCLRGSDADAWLVAVDASTVRRTDLELWLTQLPHALIIDDVDKIASDAVGHGAWRRRVGETLCHLSGNINLAGERYQAPHSVWVLAASTGGQEAVRQFLRALPTNLGVGFIFVQHADGCDLASTVIAMNKQGRYAAYAAEHGCVIKANRTAVLGADQWAEIAANGTVLLRPKRWPGRYSPSIDQVIANVARVYRRRCGAIVFSGMSDDGAVGVRLLHQQGGQVWVQTPSSCVSGALPEAILGTQLVHQLGTPAGLALQLAKWVQQEPPASIATAITN